MLETACNDILQPAGTLSHHGTERSSAGTAGAGVSVETGRRVKVTESIADRAAPAVDQPRFVRLRWIVVCRHSVVPVSSAQRLSKNVL
jgi:hypothetical protein